MAGFYFGQSIFVITRERVDHMKMIKAVLIAASFSIIMTGCKAEVETPKHEINVQPPSVPVEPALPPYDAEHNKGHENAVQDPPASLEDKQDRGYDEQPQEEYAEDGNNVDDMLLGDAGVLGLKAFSVPAKNSPTKGTQASMIAFGKTFLGRPYQYGAQRGNPASFDCSSFTQYAYKQARGMNIGADSRTQKAYTQANGQHRWGRLNWRKSSPGDLFFFTDYVGSSKSAYSSVTANSRISHVGIYLGNGQLLHTASAPTGVRIQNIAGTHLEYRLVYVGRPYRG